MQPNNLTYIPIPTSTLRRLGEATTQPGRQKTVDHMSAALTHYALAAYWEQLEHETSQSEAGLENLREIVQKIKDEHQADASVSEQVEKPKRKYTRKPKPAVEVVEEKKTIETEAKTTTTTKNKAKTTSKPKAETKKKTLATPAAAKPEVKKTVKQKTETVPPTAGKGKTVINGQILRELRLDRKVALANLAFHTGLTYKDLESIENASNLVVLTNTVVKKIVKTLWLTSEETHYLTTGK